MRIKMVVKKAFRPGGSGSPMLQPGSVFEAPGQSLARTYRSLGLADDAPPEEVEQPKPQLYARRDMEPETLEKTEPASDSPPKRRYQRRDMTAKTED